MFLQLQMLFIKPEQSQRAPGGYKNNNNYTSVIRNEVISIYHTNEQFISSKL